MPDWKKMKVHCFNLPQEKAAYRESECLKTFHLLRPMKQISDYRALLLKIILSLAGISMLDPTTGFALEPRKELTQYQYTNWGVKDGLGNMEVLDMIQTRDGYLWIANFGGIVRFDGIEFSIYDRVNYPNLDATGFWTLAEDELGTLWLGGNGGGLYTFKDGVFKAYTTENGLLSNVVQFLDIDKTGTLWIGTSNGLNFIAPNTGNTIEAFAPETLEGTHIIDLQAAQNGSVWVATQEKGIFQIEDHRLIEFQTPDGFPQTGIRRLFMTSDDWLWVIAENSDVYRTKNHVVSAITIGDNKEIGRIYGLFEDSEGNIWIGADHAILRWNAKGLRQYVDRETFTGWRSFFEDNEGNLWIGTHYNGLIRASNGKFTNFSTLEGLSDNTVNVIFEDLDGSILIGSNGGVDRLKNGEIEPYFPLRGKLPSERVREIFRDSHGDLLVGTQGGLTRLQDDEVNTITTEDGLRHNQARVLMEDHLGNLWIGTRNGISRLINGELTSFSEKDGLEESFIIELFEDSLGNVWVGTAGGGIFRFDNRSNRFENFNREDGISGDTVFRFYEDNEGALWIGTDNGITLYRNGSFKSLKSKCWRSAVHSGLSCFGR